MVEENYAHGSISYDAHNILARVFMKIKFWKNLYNWLKQQFRKTEKMNIDEYNHKKFKTAHRITSNQFFSPFPAVKV